MVLGRVFKVLEFNRIVTSKLTTDSSTVLAKPIKNNVELCCPFNGFGLRN